MSHTEHEDAAAVPLVKPVRFWVWNQPRVAEALELSERGVFLKTASVLGEGQHLTLRLELPSDGRITVLGRVVRTVKGGLLATTGMGVRFLDLTPSQRASIGQFVESRAIAGLAA